MPQPLCARTFIAAVNTQRITPQLPSLPNHAQASLEGEAGGEGAQSPPARSTVSCPGYGEASFKGAENRPSAGPGRGRDGREPQRAAPSHRPGPAPRARPRLPRAGPAPDPALAPPSPARCRAPSRPRSPQPRPPLPPPSLARAVRSGARGPRHVGCRWAQPGPRPARRPQRPALSPEALPGRAVPGDPAPCSSRRSPRPPAGARASPSPLPQEERGGPRSGARGRAGGRECSRRSRSRSRAPSAAR